ncbi:MAG: 30S ribosomal protein S20 [Alphaproteobacteria bacterium]|nr:MAG: 30S ribosomal protein S20 [Alphaproteobacteria bacterium]TAE83046.1 MAG: 30S ribosomal protein S20 [Alphaproteobacteria bacterium]TAF14999.1 MAG: 30S ribosomal protein S20 [Alphaproteobacteria bacterium]TAF40429.1 MAG: 30S ribosomal protein S20 [Alphaproteobacteria bacterium]TAF76625.1 MAG: 30S ribosomal protein S20 [Alphaproteobacteria bacterium]
MAHHKSAKKRIRQTERVTAVNRARRSRVRTFIKNVEAAIAQGDYALATEAFKHAEPEIRRGVTKGVLKLNTASRQISRLAASVKKLAS